MEILDPGALDDAEHADELAKAMAATGLVKQSVDEWLNQVDYSELNSGHYMPGTFAFKFMNFIKLVNGQEGEQNKTPVVHLAMLDQLAGTKKRIANLCARGMAKALALDTPILTSLGYVPLQDIHPGDEVFDRNGELTTVTHESEIFHKPTYKVSLADGTSFVASEDHLHIVQWRSTRRGKKNPDGTKAKTETFWKEADLTPHDRDWETL